MLSYMVPVEEKPPPAPGKARMALELVGSPGSPESAQRRARVNISKESSTSSFASDLTVSSSTPTGALDKPKHKLLANGTKHTSLKRVSFGSSKGSMVETLIYESPLQEEPEGSPPARVQETSFPYIPPAEDDSERSKVRVSFYQGAQPQCLSPPPALPVPHHYVSSLLANDHEDMADHAYTRQTSTESGWDNPFRPDGDLSREADEIVSLIKGGKPITPTVAGVGDHDTAFIDSAQEALLDCTNLQMSPPLLSPLSMSSPTTPAKASSPILLPKATNGTKNGALPERPGPVEVQRSPPQQPQQPEHVTIKKKKFNCCCIIL